MEKHKRNASILTDYLNINGFEKVKSLDHNQIIDIVNKKYCYISVFAYIKIVIDGSSEGILSDILYIVHIYKLFDDVFIDSDEDNLHVQTPDNYNHIFFRSPYNKVCFIYNNILRYKINHIVTNDKNKNNKIINYKDIDYKHGRCYEKIINIPENKIITVRFITVQKSSNK